MEKDLTGGRVKNIAIMRSVALRCTSALLLNNLWLQRQPVSLLVGPRKIRVLAVQLKSVGVDAGDD